jgi:hypothetical protein
MAYNVSQGPVQVIGSPGVGVNAPIDFTSAFLPLDGAVPFFITIHNEGGGEIFLVRAGELTSGYVAHTGDSVTAGPYKKENADGVLELHFTAGGGNGFITFTEVLEEKP